MARAVHAVRVTATKRVCACRTMTHVNFFDIHVKFIKTVMSPFHDPDVSYWIFSERYNKNVILNLNLSLHTPFARQGKKAGFGCGGA